MESYDKRGEKFVAFDLEIVSHNTTYSDRPKATQHTATGPRQHNRSQSPLLFFYNMSSSKTNYKALSEILMANLTVDGLKKTIKLRHPSMSLQGNKEDLQKRLADAEGLSLAHSYSSPCNTATAAAPKAKSTTSAKIKSKSKPVKLPPGVTGIPEIDARVDERIAEYNASRMKKTKKTPSSTSTGNKKSYKCTHCNKRYTSKVHDVTDLTEGLCRKCAVDEGYIIDCEYCSKKNVPEYYGNYCDGCWKAGCNTHFPGNEGEGPNFCVNCK